MGQLQNHKRSYTGKWRCGLLLMIFSALGLRLIYFAQNEENPLLYMPILDEKYYIEMGRAIAGGYWLGPDKVFFMDPLYGYILGLIFHVFGDNLTLVRLFQIVLDSVNVGLIYSIGVRVWNRPAGMTAAGLYAVYKVAFFYTLLILKTTLTITASLLFMLALLRTIERRRGLYWYLLGLFSGMITYLRANLILMAPLSVFFYWLFERPRWSAALKHAVLLAAGLATLLALAALRNYRASGQFIALNTQGGRLFFSSNNPENLTGRYNVPSFSRANPDDSEEDFQREAERRSGKALNQSEVSRYWTKQTLQFLWRNPGNIPGLLYNKLKGTLGNYEIPDIHSFSMTGQFSSLSRWPFPTFAFALAFGIPGLVIGTIRDRRVGWLFIPVLTVLITMTVFYTSSRLRMPLVPYLLIGSGISFQILIEWAREKAKTKILTLSVIIGAIGAQSLLVLPPRTYGTEDFFLAKAYWEQRDLERARSIARKGADMYPSQGRFQVLLGMISLSENRPEEAIRHNLRAVQIDSKNADAYHNTGLVYLTLGKPEAAIPLIKKALSMEYRPAFLLSLARAHEKMGDTEGAADAYLAFLKRSKPMAPMREYAADRLKSLRR